MADTVYLGYADYLPKSHTRIACVAKAVEGKWQHRDDLSAELPPVGKAFAVNLPWVKLHQPIAITAMPNPRGVDNDDKDRLIVDQASRVRQVVDFRKSGLEGARSALLEKGVVRAAPYSNDLIAAVSDDQCVIVTLSEHPVTGRLVAPSGAVKLFGFNSQIFEGDKFDDQFLEVPGRTVGEFQEEVHWHMDQDLLDSVLKRLKKFDEEGPSKSEREHIVAVLNRARALAQEDPDWDYLKDWLEGYIARTGLNLDAAPEIAAQLAELAPVRDELELLRERATEELRNEIEPEVRGAIERDLEELLLQKQQIQNDLEAQLQQINDLRSEHDDLCSDSIRLRKQLLHEVGELNTVLGGAEHPDSEDFRDLVERLRESLGASGGLLQPVEQTVPPWARIRQEVAAEPIPFPNFSERLANDAKRIGLELDDVMLVDTALRSGALAILPQDAAEIMIPAYASAATGGEFARQPLGPGILNLDDLWTDPARHALTGFARAWTTALQNSQRFYLVWLDGLQRTPIDVWLPSLVGALASQHRPRNLLVVASIDAPLLDHERIWPNFEKACVPLAPSLASIRATSYLAVARDSELESTFLHTDSAKNIDRTDFADYLDDVKESDPALIPLEAELYKAASHYPGGQATVSDRLRQTASRRTKGRNWLKELFGN